MTEGVSEKNRLRLDGRACRRSEVYEVGGEEILRPSPVDTVCRCLIVRRERARGLGRPSTEYCNE